MKTKLSALALFLWVPVLAQSELKFEVKVMSESGIAQPIPPNFKAALVADPNNFLLTPFAPCDGCAPTIARPERSTK